jgi:hypothetical protein
MMHCSRQGRTNGIYKSSLKHFGGDEVGIIIVIITITGVAEAAIVDAALVAEKGEHQGENYLLV